MVYLLLIHISRMTYTVQTYTIIVTITYLLINRAAPAHIVLNTLVVHNTPLLTLSLASHKALRLFPDRQFPDRQFPESTSIPTIA